LISILAAAGNCSRSTH